MTEKQRLFARFRLMYRAENGRIEYGYYNRGIWRIMGADTYTTCEELGGKILALTDEQLFSMYLKHRKSLKVAESRED